jgi:hypothetical protein
MSNGLRADGGPDGGNVLRADEALQQANAARNM